MEVPHREPDPVTRHRLRLVVQDELLDAPLSSLTKPESRSRLGERLFLYSTKLMEIDTIDRRPDGYSAVESALGQYKQSVWSYSSTTWRLENGVNVIRSDDNIIGLGFRVRLGAEAAHRLIAPPMYDREQAEAAGMAGSLPVFYKIPDADESVERKIKFVNNAIKDARVGGLSLVDVRTPSRQFFQSRDAGWKRSMGNVAAYDAFAPIIKLAEPLDEEDSLGA